MAIFFMVIMTIGTGYGAYVAWFSPKRFAQLIKWHQKQDEFWGGLQKDIYGDFLFDPTGPVLLLSRILSPIALGFCIWGLIISIFGA
jgi:hypothetical protein